MGMCQNCPVMFIFSVFHFDLVLLMGHDPTIPFGRQILSLERMPIPPQEQMFLLSISYQIYLNKSRINFPKSTF